MGSFLVRETLGYSEFVEAGYPRSNRASLHSRRTVAFHEVAMTPTGTPTPAGRGTPMIGMEILKGIINFHKNHLAMIQDREKKLLQPVGTHRRLSVLWNP